MVQSTITEMYQKNFNKYHFKPEAVHSFHPAGICYGIDNEICKGHYWLYSQKDYFTITMTDFQLLKDFQIEMTEESYYSIYYYESVEGERLCPLEEICCGKIKGYVACEGCFQAVYKENTFVRGMAINITPKYIQQFLATWCPNEANHFEEILCELDTFSEIPEIRLIFKQIQQCQVFGGAAHLYFESKVNEVLAILIQKVYAAKHQMMLGSLRNKDRKDLLKLAEYIGENCHEALSLDALAKKSCMSISKFKYSFKEVFNCSPGEYIRDIRINKAKRLLEAGELSIAEIAESISFKKSSAFSNCFKKATGFLPSEYKKAIRGNN